ncbi:MAG TPA: hypothetical protein VF572_02350 [Candidatus Saccharimonadales bacterium]|jgi:hypothetical protein
MEKTALSDLGRLLQQSVRAGSHPGSDSRFTLEPTIHVPNVGNALLYAYEQLRNASENIEDHLLFQSTIRRFYKRNISFAVEKPPKHLGQELITELTQAEYIKNDTVAVSTAAKLDELIALQYASYWDMLKPDGRLRHEVAQKWVLESLTVKSEQLFNRHDQILAFAAFAHAHFSKLIDVSEFVTEGEQIDPAEYPVLLYIAIHKALLKSNDANIRNALSDTYANPSSQAAGLIAFNIKYDKLSNLGTTARLSRIINRNGAALRVIRSAFFSRSENSTVPDIGDKESTLQRISEQVTQEYAQVRRNLNIGIVKSIIFLLITKALVGLLIEIPYDIWVTGAIAILPLIVNLVFPPLFIAITALTFRMPSEVNKKAIGNYISALLYEPGSAIQQLHPAQRVNRSYLFNLSYVIIFVIAFYAVAKALELLHFNFIQAVIFFIFLSTASFLGYRLTLQIRELELIPTGQGFFALLRDTLYAPFIFTGRRISYRFARMNIIAQILDTVIELPLTTVLRLLRQWTAFLSSKQDDLT